MTKNQIAVIETDSVILSMKRAGTALAEAKTIQQTKQILDIAHMAEIYAKRQRLGEEAMDIALSIKVEALRKLGEMLLATPKATGAKGLPGGGTRGSKKEPRVDDAPTLEELGLTKKESAVAQKLAALSETDFDQVREGHITVAKAIAVVSQSKPAAPASQPAAPQKPAAAQAQPEDDGPDDFEIMAAIAAEKADADALQKLLNADDKLATAYAEIKRLNAELAVVKQARDGHMNKANELIKTVKRLQSRLDKLERAAA